MRSSQHTRNVCLVLALAMAAWSVGCQQEAEKPVTAKKLPSATSKDDGKLAQPLQSLKQPESPKTPAGLDTPKQPEPPGQPTTDPSASGDNQSELTSSTPETPEVPETPAAPETPAVAGLVAVKIELPAPAFRGTPVPGKEPHVEKPLERPRDPFFAPAGTVNLALAMPVFSSDPAPVAGELDYVTDGDKEASDFGYLELRPGTEWVQVDLGQKATIYAVVIWHNHAEARVYRDVVVQVSDDPDFLDAQTVFNNDYDNTSGMGIGDRMGYVETSEGKLIDCKGVQGRYVRFYSKGNHIDAKNHYTEVDVYGRPAS